MLVSRSIFADQLRERGLDEEHPDTMVSLLNSSNLLEQQRNMSKS